MRLFFSYKLEQYLQNSFVLVLIINVLCNVNFKYNNLTF